MKKCTRCKYKLSFNHFSKNISKDDNLNNQCKKCDHLQHRKYYEENIEKVKQKNKKYSLENREKINERKKIYNQKNFIKLKQQRKNNNLKFKIECFNAYGGCFCKCCNEKELTFLSLDHVNNDGAVERKTLGKGRSFKIYIYLKKLNYPDKHRYQVLCMNCQWGKRFNNTCPHKK